MNPLRIAGYFLIFGCAWILVSDRALELLVADAAQQTAWQSAKGVAFVLLSAGLIYLLVRRAERQQASMVAETQRDRDRLIRMLHVNPAVIYSLRPTAPGRQSFAVDFVGHNVRRVTGYTAEQWLATPTFWIDHVHPDDRGNMQEHQESLLATGTLSHEYRFLRGDGQYRWINDNLIVLRSDAGEVEQIIGSWLDVTDRKQAELAMADSEQRHRALFESNPLPMWVYDIETLRFLSVNNAARSQYGYTHAEFLGMTIKDIRPPDEVPRLLDNLKIGAGDVGTYSRAGEWRHRRKDGSAFWVEVSGNTISYAGRPARFVLAHDISDRRQAEERLRLIAQVFQSSQEGILITDADTRFISVNRAFTSITGYDMDDLAGRKPSFLSSGRHDKAFYAAMWAQLSAQGRWEGEIWNRRKDGEVFPEWLTISAIRDTEGRVRQYLGIFTETSSRKAAEDRIQRLANYDNLTGLPNRALLSDRTRLAIAGAARHGNRLAVMHLNVDRFKVINESLGHEGADQVLAELAGRLTASLKADDTVSRMGGDDFIVLLPNITARNVAQIALRLLGRVAEPFSIAGQELSLTASIGVAEYPDNGPDLVHLLQAAEFAVHQAKKEGRNTFQFFSGSMQEQVKRSLAIENDLRHAVQRNQLVLHYQPQVNVATQRIVGVEALVRWQHPQRGLVSPASFIPVAEESGLIREIGQWVMLEALTQNAAWRAAGIDIVPVAVNLSVVQFRHSGLRDSIVDALRQSGLPAEMVELELTESVAMENSDFTIATIDGLKRLGVMLSIDDFGTGYSSLSYLKRFDIDKLKIDQSFVRGLNVDPDDEAIVTTVISLARSLGLRTIAEGVETQEQLAFLRANGCDEYQGYLYSRPVPAEEFFQLLKVQTASGADPVALPGRAPD